MKKQPNVHFYSTIARMRHVFLAQRVYFYEMVWLEKYRDKKRVIGKACIMANVEFRIAQGGADLYVFVKKKFTESAFFMSMSSEFLFLFFPKSCFDDFRFSSKISAGKIGVCRRLAIRHSITSPNRSSLFRTRGFLVPTKKFWMSPWLEPP